MKTTFRVSISGIDGTGKTTLVRKIQELYFNRNSEIYSLSAPQFHENPILPFSNLSQTIEILNKEADHRKDPVLKSLAFFLSMSLYGDIEKFIISTFQPQVFIGERQPLLDTLTYGHFYLPLLAKKMSSSSSRDLNESLIDILGTDSVVKIENWMDVVTRRESSITIPFSLQTALQYFSQVFAGTPDQVISRFSQLYHSQAPDLLFILTTHPESIINRIAEKKVNTSTSELHEDVQVLLQLDQALKNCVKVLKAFSPQLQIFEIQTGSRSVDETVQIILDRIHL